MMLRETFNRSAGGCGEVEDSPLPARVTFLAGTLAQGGAERQLYYILQALRGKGVAVRLLSLGRNEHWQEPIQELGVPITWVGQTRSRWKRLLRICRELQQEIPDVVQSQHFYTNLYSSVAARWLGLPSVGAIRNDVRSEMADVGGFVGRLNLIMPRMLAANSRSAIKTALDFGVSDRRCWLLPNVVDTARFHPGCRQQNGCVRILGMGRLVAQKRFDRFLRVIASVAKQTSLPIEGLIAGAGPLKAELTRQAAELGLQQVSFLDALPDPSSLFREVDIFLLSSDHEGTPNVVLEAMASALPVVATSVGGTNEIVRHAKSGLLAKPDEEHALSEHVSQLVENRALREKFGAAAREHVQAHHAVRRLPEVLSGLYQKVLGPRHTAKSLTHATAYER